MKTKVDNALVTCVRGRRASRWCHAWNCRSTLQAHAFFPVPVGFLSSALSALLQFRPPELELKGKALSVFFCCDCSNRSAGSCSLSFNNTLCEIAGQSSIRWRRLQLLVAGIVKQHTRARNFDAKFLRNVLSDPPPSPAATELSEREESPPRGVPQLSRTEVRRVAPFLYQSTALGVYENSDVAPSLFWETRTRHDQKGTDE